MKKDILNREDIIQIVDVFYNKVRADSVIGIYFTDVVPVNWDKHLPIMYNFWENVLFIREVLRGIQWCRFGLHGLHAIGKDAFEHWVSIFCQTVDELFSGQNAETIKVRARNIAMIMNSQLNPE